VKAHRLLSQPEVCGRIGFIQVAVGSRNDPAPNLDSASATPSGWPRPASKPLWAAGATPATTPVPGRADPLPGALEDSRMELATFEWASWFNNYRRMAPLDYVPPVEFDTNYYHSCNPEQQAMPARLKPPAASKPGAVQSMKWRQFQLRTSKRRTTRTGKRSHGQTGTPSSPVVSGRPQIRFAFCTAWPAAPLPRLSTTPIAITRLRSGSAA